MYIHTQRVCVYMYIYREREKYRERDVYTHQALSTYADCTIIYYTSILHVMLYYSAIVLFVFICTNNS